MTDNINLQALYGSTDERIIILLDIIHEQKRATKLIYEKLARQLETSNLDGAKILIKHCLEQIEDNVTCEAK